MSRDRERDITQSDDPALVAARVFVANLQTEKISIKEVHDQFSPFGKVLGVALLKGFGFVQYSSEAEAKKACAELAGSFFKGSRIDVKLASNRRKQQNSENNSANQSFDAEPAIKRFANSNQPPADQGGNSFYRSGSSNEFGDRGFSDNRFSEEARTGGSSDRFSGDRADLGAGGRGVSASRLSDHGGRALHEPEPEDAFPIPKRKDVGVDRPFDVAVIVTQKQLKSYAEHVERKLIEINLTVDIIFLINEDALERAVDDMIRRGLLYIIVLQQQHEKYRSLTAFILHGKPQEHRNMPLEDCLTMLAKNFNTYVSSLRIGSEQPSMGFLLNLLADGKHLSVDELNRIVAHLQDRRDRLLESQGLKAPSRSEASLLAKTSLLSGAASAALKGQGGTGGSQSAASTGTTKTPQKQTAELQQRIMNILSGSGKPPSAGAQAPAGGDDTARERSNSSSSGGSGAVGQLLSAVAAGSTGGSSESAGAGGSLASSLSGFNLNNLPLSGDLKKTLDAMLRKQKGGDSSSNAISGGGGRDSSLVDEVLARQLTSSASATPSSNPNFSQPPMSSASMMAGGVMPPGTYPPGMAGGGGFQGHQQPVVSAGVGPPGAYGSGFDPNYGGGYGMPPPGTQQPSVPGYGAGPFGPPPGQGGGYGAPSFNNMYGGGPGY